jgi:GR25 family glycosyltransferase involved in LPS biosynthesis
MLEKFCFLSEAHYPNYVNRIKKYNIKRYLELGLNIPFYISTNLPEQFSEYKDHELIRVFDINELRKNNINSLKYELLPEDPTGLYPAKYPWNLRRFIIRKAVEDGFTGLFFLECDTKINQNIEKERLLSLITNLYEPNTVKTSSARFVYKNRHEGQELFGYHKDYIRNLNLKYNEEDYDTLDGTNQLFFGKNSESLLNFLNNWDFICDYGYMIENGYKNGYLSNLSFVIPMSDFKLIHTDTPFQTDHVFEDRYTYGNIKNNTEIIEFHEEPKFKNKSNLNEILEKFSCEKSQNEFSSLFENYLTHITQKNPNILEIGVGTLTDIPLPGMSHVPANMRNWKENNPNYRQGNFLRALKEFLQTGNIYGIDIQPDCQINEERINTYIFDSRSLKNTKETLQEKKFDLIIDDGDMDPNIRIINFNNFFNYVKDDGYYVIQGLLNKSFLENYFRELEISFMVSDSYLILSKTNNFELINNKIKTDDTQIKKEEDTIEEKIDYKILIESTQNFSINGNVFADKGFYINLKNSKDRKLNVEKLIDKYNIEGLLRFSALKDEMIQYSCTKSHLSVFKTCLDNGVDTVFVAEDDFQIEDYLYQPSSEPINFLEKIREIKKDLDNVEWDVFLFGCNPKTHLIPVTSNLAVVNKSTGAWAYIIKRRAFEYLLNNLNYKRDYIAIDDYLPLLNDKGFVTLTSIPLTIGHAVGFVSTLQPSGPVNYTDWIKGAYHKFLFDNYPDNNYVENKIEKNLTIFIPGFFCKDYLNYLRFALKSLPDKLRKCKFIIRFDIPSNDYDLSEFIKLQAYFRDVRNDLNVSLSYGFGGLISSFDFFLKNVKTPYFMMYEFDYVFLNKNKVDFSKIIESFDKYNFINTVYLSGDDISVRGFDLATDVEGKVTPFELENRVDEINLVTTTRWSNRPAVHRVSKMKEWFDKYMKNEHIGILHQSCYGLEDAMIPQYQKIISENKWEDIKDDWGTYLYGNFGEGPFVGHTDSSKRYQNEIKSILEINADKYVIENPLTEQD